MDWSEAILRIIDMATFSSIWYWLVVIVIWAVASSWIIGVPFDLLFLARKADDARIHDLEVLVDVHVRRIAWYHRYFGPFLFGFGAFVLTALGFMGFGYGFEFAQGLFALAAPLALVALLNLRLALELVAAPLTGRALVQRMFAMRIWIQIVAMIALFFTAIYGIYHSMRMFVFL